MGDIDDVSVLSRTAAALLAARTRDEVYDTVGSCVHELSGALATVITRYNEDDRTLDLARLLGFDGLQTLIRTVAGIDYESASISLSSLPGEELREFTSGRLARLPDGLHNLSARMLSRSVGRAVELALGIRSVWTMGFSWEGKFFGGVSLLLHADAEPERPAVVEAVVSLGAVALQRTLSEERLRHSEERHRTLFETSPDAIVLVDASGYIIAANPRMCGLLALEPGTDWAGRRTRITEVVAADESRRLALQLDTLTRTGKTASATYHCAAGGGPPVPVEIMGAVVGERPGPASPCMLVLRDLTERERLQEQLVQAQRMEAVGRLAGGVAHDFNNLLTVITGYTEVILGDLPTESPLRECAGEIRKSAARAAELTSQLLSFSRRQIVRPDLLDANALLGEVVDMVRRMVGEDVLVDLEQAPEPLWIRVDRGQISQVLLNLAANARDAMPNGGRLVIRTAKSPAVADLPSGAYVLMEVSDTGAGMDGETLKHVFEPFFTTKGSGHGIGLGLPTVHGIVTQAGGAVTARSLPSQGTVVSVYLPEVQGVGRTPDAGAVQDEGVMRGEETILLAEDEPSLRRFVRTVLEERGFTVLEAQDGPSAIELGTRHGKHIDLLLTDLVMPGMSGREAAERLRGLIPDLRVLYVSGHTDDAIIRQGIETRSVPFMHKPFGAAALVAKVREVLDGPVVRAGADVLP